MVPPASRLLDQRPQNCPGLLCFPVASTARPTGNTVAPTFKIHPPCDFPHLRAHHPGPGHCPPASNSPSGCSLQSSQRAPRKRHCLFCELKSSSCTVLLRALLWVFITVRRKPKIPRPGRDPCASGRLTPLSSPLSLSSLSSTLASSLSANRSSHALLKVSGGQGTQ